MKNFWFLKASCVKWRLFNKVTKYLHSVSKLLGGSKLAGAGGGGEVSCCLLISTKIQLTQSRFYEKYAHHRKPHIYFLVFEVFLSKSFPSRCTQRELELL